MCRAGICTVALVICICFVLTSHAFFNSEVSKAKEFIKADMYPQVIELLNKRINDEPTEVPEADWLPVFEKGCGNQWFNEGLV